MQGKTTKRQTVKFQGGNFQLVTEETPQLKDGQILIKVAYSPVTNFDKACFTVKQNVDKPEGKILGSEGSGTVEDVGPGVDQMLKGKKVAFCCGGWSQYVVEDVDHCLFFNDSVDLRDAATACINPLTALCIRQLCLDKGHQNLIFLGANSTLGRQFIRLCQQKDMKVIALVQGKDEATQLQNDLGYNLIWDYTDQNFMDELQNNIIPKYNITAMKDCVGGEISGKIFAKMPEKSVLCVLGNLSNEDLKICSSEFFIHQKSIESFNLVKYVSESLSENKRREFMKIIQEDFNSGGKLFKTSIATEMNLSEWNKALDKVETCQDQGKVLLCCSC